MSLLPTYHRTHPQTMGFPTKSSTMVSQSFYGNINTVIHSGSVVLKWEWVYEGSCASWWLWGLVAPGLGRLKPDTTGSSHRGRPASDFSTFPFISNIIYIGGESSE